MKAALGSVLASLVWTLGCSSRQGSAIDGGSQVGDATAPAPGAEGGGNSAPADDAGDGASAPCVDYEGGAQPSDDCVLLGQCPLSCAFGTASAYACAAGDASVATYPSVFVPRADPVHVIEYLPGAGPSEGGAYVSCAPLSCVRWSLADHVNGGSAWPGDPCSSPDATIATQAWVCPSYQGFQPDVSGCFNAGVGQTLGGSGTAMAINIVWCCPAPSDDGGGESGTLDGDGRAEGGPSSQDGSVIEAGSVPEGGLDATTE